jgi:hypothetical protein
VIAGIAVGVLAMAGAIAYGTANQQNYVQEDSVLAEAATQGILPKTGMLGADLNREQWHEDPFAEKAAEVRAQWEKTNGQ